MSYQDGWCRIVVLPLEMKSRRINLYRSLTNFAVWFGDMDDDVEGGRGGQAFRGPDAMLTSNFGDVAVSPHPQCNNS